MSFTITPAPGLDPLDLIARDGQPVNERRRGRIPLAPYLYVLPAIAMLVIWIYKPLVETIELSFYSWNLLPTAPKQPVGFDNYLALLHDKELGKALVNTGIYIATFLVCSVALPLLIAMLSRRVHGRAKTIYQALIFVPFLVTPVAAAATWNWLFSPYEGIIGETIEALFGADIGNIFQSSPGAMIAIMVIVSWQLLGFGVLVINAGLSGISPDYAEAAAMDGSGRGRIFRRITMPLLSPTIMFLVLMTILLSAQWTFPMIDILTQGGPVGSTNNIYYLLYESAFMSFDAGRAGAAGTLFFIVFGLIAVGLVKLSDRLSFYDN
ncbi:MAG: carbohydrate ABC transporter permease [Cumulibacter sp.]